MPKLIDQTIIDLKLGDLNRKNLLHGKDSEGIDMPFYSNHSDYGFEKTRRNPLNRGRWDLKDTGQFHRGIFSKKIKSYVQFKQKIRSAKIESIFRKMERVNRIPLGLSQKEMTKLLQEKRPELKKKIENIIAGR